MYLNFLFTLFNYDQLTEHLILSNKLKFDTLSRTLNYPCDIKY